MNHKSLKFSRREFVGTTAMAAGAAAFIPGGITFHWYIVIVSKRSGI